MTSTKPGVNTGELVASKQAVAKVCTACSPSQLISAIGSVTDLRTSL
jgi:hypothetical protein